MLKSFILDGVFSVERCSPHPFLERRWQELFLIETHVWWEELSAGDVRPITAISFFQVGGPNVLKELGTGDLFAYCNALRCQLVKQRVQRYRQHSTGSPAALHDKHAVKAAGELDNAGLDH